MEKRIPYLGEDQVREFEESVVEMNLEKRLLDVKRNRPVTFFLLENSTGIYSLLGFLILLLFFFGPALPNFIGIVLLVTIGIWFARLSVKPKSRTEWKESPYLEFDQEYHLAGKDIVCRLQLDQEFMVTVESHPFSHIRFARVTHLETSESYYIDWWTKPVV